MNSILKLFLLLAVVLQSPILCDALETYPTSDFKSDTSNGSIPLTVQFTDISTGMIDHWEWDLDGDDLIDSTEQNPTFIYQKQGIYTVTLYISGKWGEDSITKENYIKSYLPPNSPGTIKWSFEIGSFSRSSPAIDSDGNIYIGAKNANLYAINPNGSIKWTYKTGGPITISSPSIDEKANAVYVASRDGYLYAIDTAGTLKWQILLQKDGYSDSTPTIGPSGTIYVTSSGLFDSSTKYMIHAINTDGTVSWARTSLSRLYDPVISSTENVFLVSNNRSNISLNKRGHYFTCYDKNGSIVWVTKLTQNYYSGKPMPPALGTHIYIPADDHLYALNYDGEIEWIAKEEDDCYHQFSSCNSQITEVTSVIVGKNMLYLGNWKGILWAVKPETGIAQWMFSPHISTPAIYGTPIIGSSRNIYALYYTQTNQGKGRLYCISPTGEKKWYCEVGRINANSSSPVINNGTLYVVSDMPEPTLYAINIEDTSILDSAWPMLQHDLKHTGYQENDPPKISIINDQQTKESTPTSSIQFTIYDIETDAAELSIFVSSSNTELISNNNILLGGEGVDRFVILSPEKGKYGHSTISIFVRDTYVTSETSFLLTVNNVVRPGDLNDNGLIELIDLLKALNIVAGNDVDTYYIEADIDGNNRIDLYDVIFIQNYLANLPDTLDK